MLIWIYFYLKYNNIKKKGGLTQIGLRISKFQRLSQPYTQCLSDLTSNSPNQTELQVYMFQVLRVPFYTYKLCEALLFSRHLYAQCACKDKSFLIEKEISLICHTADQLKCLNRFRAGYSMDNSNNCPLGQFISIFNYSVVDF